MVWLDGAKLIMWLTKVVGSPRNRLQVTDPPDSSRICHSEASSSSSEESGRLARPKHFGSDRIFAQFELGNAYFNLDV